jgi:uncharacterized protein (DUF1501 family)
MSATRRTFIKSSLGLSASLSLGGVASHLGAASCVPSTPRRDDSILVVIQLSGGNDGLNSVIPYEDDEYGRNRPTLRFRREEVLPVGTDLGFHPEMTGLHRLFQEGVLSVVQGVGYPNPDGDHDASMRIWRTGELAPSSRGPGWLGRAIDVLSDASPGSIPGVFVSGIQPTRTTFSERTVVPAVDSLNRITLKAPLPSSHENVSGTNSLLAHARRATDDAQNVGARIENVLSSSIGGTRVEYPSFGLAADLRTIAQIIRADIGVRVFSTELGGDGFGGFDNHANQRDNHGALLRQLSESVAAFVDDLSDSNLLDRVLLTTFSEFGRTVAENGRRGTGHASAAPMFMAGGGLKGGLIGEHPDLSGDLENAGPAHHTDFRGVYATLLDQWIGVDSISVLSEEFEHVDILKS